MADWAFVHVNLMHGSIIFIANYYSYSIQHNAKSAYGRKNTPTHHKDQGRLGDRERFVNSRVLLPM